jgi:hypothetical protein
VGGVDVDVSRFDGRAEKINITVPRNLLAKTDSYARATVQRAAAFWPMQRGWRCGTDWQRDSSGFQSGGQQVVAGAAAHFNRPA